MWPAVPTMRLRILHIAALPLSWIANAQDDPATFQSARTEVRLDVQVLQGKRAITDLSRANFTIRDEGAPVDLTYFGREAEPLSLVLLLDVSGSMRRYIDEMSTAASQALQNLRPGDRVAVMVYGRRPQLHLDFTTHFDEVARAIKSGPTRNDTGAGTSTNEAVLAATRLLINSTGRRGILIVTDNGGLNEGLNDEQVIREMTHTNTVLNAIAVGKAERPKGDSVNPYYTSTDIFALAEATGGEALRSAKAGSALGGILERIRARYALAYNLPTSAKPGTFRKVSVTVNKKAEVRVRSGYYAPAANASGAGLP